MKKLLNYIAALSLCLAVSADAASVVYQGGTTGNASGAVTNTLTTNGLLVTSYLIQNNGTNTLNIRFFDAPYTNVTYTNAAYIGATNYSTNYVTTWTNYLGYTNSITNTVMVYATNTVSANTNNYRTLLLVSVVTNQGANSFTFTPQYGQIADYGLLFTNSASGTNYTITINYQPLQ